MRQGEILMLFVSCFISLSFAKSRLQVLIRNTLSATRSNGLSRQERLYTTRRQNEMTTVILKTLLFVRVQRRSAQVCFIGFCVLQLFGDAGFVAWGVFYKLYLWYWL